MASTVDGQLRALAPAAVLRRMDRESRAARRHAACAGFSRLPGRHPDGREHGDAVRGGLALKKTGNELLRVLGGREIHPVNVRVGGFYRVPRRAEFAPVAEQLKRARDLAIETVRWVATFPFPDYEPRLRVCLAASPGRVSDQRGPHRLLSRSRHQPLMISTANSRNIMSRTRRRCIPV